MPKMTMPSLLPKEAAVAQSPKATKLFLSPTEAAELGLPRETGFYQVTLGNDELGIDLAAIEDGRVYQRDITP